MKRTVVSYKIKADRIEENTRLLENVFKELEAKTLRGVRYVTLQSGDGWYTHFTTVDSDGVNPITTTRLVQGLRCRRKGALRRAASSGERCDHCRKLSDDRRMIRVQQAPSAYEHTGNDRIASGL